MHLVRLQGQILQGRYQLWALPLLLFPAAIPVNFICGATTLQ